jgi:uncharacterized protein DUF6057
MGAQWGHVAMSKPLPWRLGLLVLGMGCFALLNWTYGYVIAFQAETNDCFFMFGHAFVEEFLGHPGGLLRYAGRFLGQFYHYQWLGALVVSASVVCFGFLLDRVQRKLDSAGHAFRTLSACLLLLALHTSSVYVLHDTLGLIAVCAVFLGCLCLRRRAIRRLCAVAAVPILYLLFGFYAWLFVAWAVLSDRREDRSGAGLAFRIGYVVLAMAAPWVAWRWLFMISVKSAFLYPTMFTMPSRAGWEYCTLTALVTDCVLAAALCALLVSAPLSGGRPTKTRARRRIAVIVALAVVALLFHVIRHDPAVSAFAACRQLYKGQQWDALLERAKANPYRDLRVQFMINFALCQKGKLLDEMFSYPQQGGARGLVFNPPGKLTPGGPKDDTPRAMYNSDLFYAMGHVNLAFRYAFNHRARLGRTYASVARMAECNLVNGNRALAAKYVGMLEKALFHSSQARRWRAALADPGAMDREFGEARKRRPTVERNMIGLPVLPLLSLLETRPDNRMAFDYLTAWCLVDKTPMSRAAISASMDAFRKAGYTSLPGHYQEALLLLEKRTDEPLDLGGFSYEPAIRTRVEAFFRDHRNRAHGIERLRSEYGDMYVFYYYLTRAPSVSRQLIRTRTGLGDTERLE